MIRVKVRACGVCRADLCIVEGQLGSRDFSIIPGHGIVGDVDRCGGGAHRFQPGDRVGIAWLRSACGQCRHCRNGQENLCHKARFTGYDENGGYGEYALVREDFAFALPNDADPLSAAPLLSSGIVGYRAMKLANIKPGDQVGIYGFGSSAHLCIQLARLWKCDCHVVTRQKAHQTLATELGAVWAGGMDERPAKPLNAAIVFAPYGEAVQLALEALDGGGTCVTASICSSPVPALDYEHDLFRERKLRSVCGHTRQDGEEFLRIAADQHIKPHTTPFELGDANGALLHLKQGALRGSAVLVIDC